jgi:hypothetical protein
MQLHVNQDHPDKPILEHTQELTGKLDLRGIKPSSVEEDGLEEGQDWDDR